jgi:RimJ/RimL family protein N-acetyltransferase
MPLHRQGPARDLRACRVVFVRKAKIDDAEDMAVIMAAVAEEGLIATEPPVDLEERAQRFRELIEGPEPAGAWVLLDDAERIVGNAGAHERAPGVLYLGMAILPEARGRGGGRALLEAIVGHARACRAHKIELEVWTDNARAIALYASAGFEVEGLRRDHYRRRDGRLRSALLMARLLQRDEPGWDHDEPPP